MWSDKAFSVFSCDRSDEKPIASTCLPIYNENLEMRQGPFSLFLWPESLPDIRLDTRTPGLIEDKKFMALNSDLRNLEMANKLMNQPLRKNEYIDRCTKLTNKIHLVNKSLPFATLVIELPDVFYPSL